MELYTDIVLHRNYSMRFRSDYTNSNTKYLLPSFWKVALSNEKSNSLTPGGLETPSSHKGTER